MKLLYCLHLFLVCSINAWNICQLIFDTRRMTSEISPALFPFFSCCFIKVQFSYTYRSADAAILLRNFKAVSLLLVLNVCRIVPHMYWKLCNSFHTSLYCKNQLRYINKLCGQIAGFLVSNQLVHILTTGFLRFVNGIPHVLTHFRVACKDKRLALY